MWTKLRLTAYVATFLTGAAIVLSGMGLGTYDAAAGTFDLGPVNINVIAPVIAGTVSSLIAALAVLFKWGPSK